MSVDKVYSLNFISLQSVPEPFLSEYAAHYRVHNSHRLNHIQLVSKIIAAGRDRSNPPTVPVLPGHEAKIIGGVLHLRYKTAPEYANPETHGAFPAERLPDPDDDYSDGEGHIPAPKRIPQRTKPAMISMDFVYPPKGRRVMRPTEEDLKREKAGLYEPPREPLPEDYIGAMYVDLERESKAAIAEFEAAEELMKDALYEYEALQLEVEMERTAWTGLWTYLTKVAGKEVANNCIVRARERAAGRIHPDEVERAIRDGDLPDPNHNKASEWRALVATRPNSPVRPPIVPAPPLGRPPAPPLGRAHAPPLPRATANLPSLNAKFGGTVTSFQQGVFLKRRRDSDAGSDSDCDSDDDADAPPRNSGISRTRKRARGSMNAAAATGFHAFGSAATTLGVKNPAFMWSTPAFGGGALGGVPSTFGGGISAFGGATSAFGAGTSTFGGAIPAFGSGLSAKAPPAPPVVSCTSLPHGGAQSSESELPIQKAVKRHSPAQKSPTSRTSPAQKSATRSSRRPMAAGHPRLESLPPLPSPTSSESAFLTASPRRSTVMA